MTTSKRRLDLLFNQAALLLYIDGILSKKSHILSNEEMKYFSWKQIYCLCILY
ncbi:hypothetical protein BAXH7_01979 [Bacillus amyloliquefaciens XH7]|nr:hypothetical protein LL3_01644 [Bacillus amyloliquefaciens LL3]AEK89111.1 hypothetical protein BAXH7_01979 [Bacillus amyloliquefaciens XH7]KYC94613.1 hypothetical protein B425_1527 [Bacillus amyloliquefaciens]QBG55955.1 hypothetical protein D2M30_1625 [Bacillus amyloliquefaciens]